MESSVTTPLRSGLPRHEQVSTWIKTRIDDRTLDIDDRLPSESQLCKRFGVSRITVRRALQTLEAEGLIYKRQGLGSFVRGPQVPQGFVHLSDFVEDMAAAGIRARSDVLSWESEAATPKVANALAIEDGAMVIRMDRLRYADDDPIAYDSTWFRPGLEPALRKGELDKESIYHILEEFGAVRVCRARFRIEAVNAPNDVAGHLNLPWGRALLLIERTTYSEGETPVCFQMRYYRSDRVAYELSLDRGHGIDAASGEGLPLREFEPVFKR